MPTVAYSGEIDRQKQAADVMARALKPEGMELTHLIGPNTPHRYHPETKKEIDLRIDALAAKGRDPVPSIIHFDTWTLRYNRCSWVRIDELERHWERATVVAWFMDDKGIINASTKNVSALTVAIPPGYCRGTPIDEFVILMDGAWRVAGISVPVTSDRSLTVHLRKTDGKWQKVPSPDDGTIRKRPGLQGPIDDAFMDRFLMVRPTGQPLNEKVGAWAKGEMEHAIVHWRRQFRGDAPVKDDTAVSDADIASSNLALWGDPSSNKLLAKIADRLPVKWTAEGVRVGDRTFPADTHVPVLIYPNPLNPKKYVVLNSGFTFREYDYLNNARQVPKLPDYAVLDVSVAPNSRTPGKVVLADFFDEQWKLKTEK